jgi:8-oxo-dGTP pyrophosphatase MutT (NUDIX family)
MLIVFIFIAMMNKDRRTIIKAGGGLVENEKGEFLFMFRRSKWDLPKGKLDSGESLENCALREVKEETGIRDLEIKRFLIVTQHAYQERGIGLVKETHWWLMKANSQQSLIPQAEEDITQLKWFGPSEMSTVLGNTYPNIVEVLKAGKFSGI